MNNSERKQKALDLCAKHWITGRGERFAEWGVPFVMGKREEYVLTDIDGHEVIDAHLNGGTYNLGHRNPYVMKSLITALGSLDMGNHHFPSEERGLFAEKLISVAPGDYSNVVMVNSGSEAIDLAVRTVRVTTKKRKILSLDVAYHGYGSVVPSQMGSGQSAKYFLSEASQTDCDTVRWNDLADAEEKLSKDDVAGLIVEVCPASAGFLIPAPGYIKGLKNLCEKYGVPYIADEVQVGMGRSGKLWAVENYNVSPDILVTAKALGGGLLPLGAIVMKKEFNGWLTEKPWAFTSTASGSELACHVGREVIEISSAKETLEHVNQLADMFGKGFSELSARQPFLKEIRQMGVIFGLVTDHPQGGMFLMRRLYENGVWAIVSSLDEAVVQFKPGLLLKEETATKMLEVLDKSLKQAKEDSVNGEVVAMY